MFNMFEAVASQNKMAKDLCPNLLLEFSFVKQTPSGKAVITDPRDPLINIIAFINITDTVPFKISECGNPELLQERVNKALSRIKDLMESSMIK